VDILLKGPTRLIYRLKNSTSLKSIDDPFFYHEIHSPAGVSLYSCKFLNLHQIPPAVLSTELKVFVRYTNGEVSLEKIDNWMKLYGELCSDSRYLLTLTFISYIHPYTIFILLFSFGKSLIEGISSEVYSVQLKLKFQIPEFLPIYGKKARVYYHGMPSFCTNCYLIGNFFDTFSLGATIHVKILSGHSKSDCKNDSKDWWSYIVHLKAAKVPESYFGSWVQGQSFEESHPSTSTGPELPADPNLVALLVKQLQTPTGLSQIQGATDSKNKKKKRERSSSSSSSSSVEENPPNPPNPPVLSQSFAPGRGFRGRGRGRYNYNRGYGYGRGRGRGFYPQDTSTPPPPAEPTKEKKKSKKDKKEKKKSKQ